MKKTTTYWLLAATMTLAGCASDNDLANNYNDNNVDAVKITATRAAANTATSTSTPLAEGETFRLINTTRQDIGRTTKYDAVYQVTSAGITPAASNNYVVWQTGNDNGGNTITQNVFNAVIPSNADYNSFNVPTDQSSADLLKSADWQTATAKYPVTAMEDKPTISLNFEHQLSNIVITISEDAKSDLASLSDIKVLGTITPYYNSTAKTIQAIVETATSIPNASLLTFKDATGESYTIPFPSSITSLDKGKQYNFTLTGGHNALTISSVSVTDWTAATVTPGKEDEASCADEDIDYITFTAESEQQIKFVDYEDDPREELNPTNPYGGQSYAITRSTNTYKYEYSINNGEWIPFDEIYDSDNVIFGGDKGTLRLRGKNTSGTGTSFIAFKNETKVACTGDIRTLLDYESYKTVDTRDANFNFLFIYCKQLISAPKLPCMNLNKDCYEGMFYGCTSLVEAPALPATTLAVSCYENMFYGCTSLVEAPALPATTLANYCYESMFEDCSSLKVAPALPATELAESCYESMFDGCSSFKVAPALPATELKYACYAYMFDDCTSLTVAPELPATTLSPYCYNYMFSDCTSLTTAPALPATDLAESCYSGMFSGCTALTKTPELKASILVTDCYSYIFLGCSNLSSVTMLAEDVNAEICLYLWLGNSGTSAQSRTLKLKNATVYNTIINTTYYNRPALPDNWKSGASGTTIIFEE